MRLALTPREERLLWVVLALAVGTRLATLGAYPLIDPSEARYAEIARKMVETGQWLVPQYEYGIPFWGKPPLAFWLTAASMQVFGVNEFAARLPSFLLMLACGLVVWRSGRAVGGRAAALLASTVFATLGLVFVLAGAVLTDIALGFGTTLVMAGFWGAVRGADEGRRAAAVALFAGLAIGLLAKGPIAAVLAFLPIAAWIGWQGAWRDSWSRVPWLAGGVATTAVVVPWYWAVERATPGFLAYFIVGEHWQRFTQPGWTGDLYGAGHAWRPGWIWLFWVLAAAPWSIVVLDWLVRCFVAPRARLAARTADPAWRYFACWALAPMVFFTVARNILPSYVLPGLPAFALLVAYGPFASDAPRALDRAEKRGLVAAALLPLLFLGLLVGGHARLDTEYAQRALVRAWLATRGDPAERLIYVGDVPVSGVFYAQGRVAQVKAGPALDAYLADATRDFVAIRPQDAAGLAAAQRARLAAVGRFGDFDLYREVLVAAAAPAR